MSLPIIIQRSQPTNLIHNFTIYGERHSGTKFLKRTIENKLNIPVIWDFGWKHFFGHYNQLISNYGNNTLFLGIVRNPYDWIMAMHKKAYHIPNSISENFNTLVSSEWISVDNKGKEKTDQFGNFEDRNFHNNQRYKNIFELRKIKNEYLYYTMPDICANYCLINYEQLIDNFHKVLAIISSKFSLPISKKGLKIHNYNQYNISDESIKNLITSNISWDIENKLGYYDKN